MLNTYLPLTVTVFVINVKWFTVPRGTGKLASTLVVTVTPRQNTNVRPPCGRPMCVCVGGGGGGVYCSSFCPFLLRFRWAGEPRVLGAMHVGGWQRYRLAHLQGLQEASFLLAGRSSETRLPHVRTIEMRFCPLHRTIGLRYLMFPVHSRAASASLSRRAFQGHRVRSQGRRRCLSRILRGNWTERICAGSSPVHTNSRYFDLLAQILCTPVNFGV